MIIEIGDFVEELDGRISGPVTDVTDNLVYIKGKLSDCCIRKYNIKKVYKKPDFVERPQYILNPGDYIRVRPKGQTDGDMVIGPLLHSVYKDNLCFIFDDETYSACAHFNRNDGSSLVYNFIEKVNIVPQ